MPSNGQLGQATNASALNGTLNKLKSLITKNSDSKHEAPTPNFAHKTTGLVDQNNSNAQKEANRLQTIIYNLNSIFQKNGLQNANGGSQALAPGNLAPNGHAKQLTPDNQSKQNMGHLPQSRNGIMNQAHNESSKAKGVHNNQSLKKSNPSTATTPNAGDRA